MRSSAARAALASFGCGRPAYLTHFRHCYMPFGIHLQQPFLPISPLRSVTFIVIIFVMYIKCVDGFGVGAKIYAFDMFDVLPKRE